MRASPSMLIALLIVISSVYILSPKVDHIPLAVSHAQVLVPLGWITSIPASTPAPPELIRIMLSATSTIVDSTIVCVPNTNRSPSNTVLPVTLKSPLTKPSVAPAS